MFDTVGFTTIVKVSEHHWQLMSGVGICWHVLQLQAFDTVGWVIWPVKTRPRYDL